MHYHNPPSGEKPSYDDMIAPNNNRLIAEQEAKEAEERAQESAMRCFTEDKYLPEHAAIVSMIEHKGTIIVCTTKHVYRLVDDAFQPMKFIFVDDVDDA